jgi:hypothetical protein
MFGWRPRGFPSSGGAMPKTCPGVPAPPGGPKQPTPTCSPSPNPSQIPSPPPGRPGCRGPAQPGVVQPVRLSDLFYSELPTADLGFLFREARVTYLPTGRASDGTGTILSYRVPDAQTLLISDVEFYAQTPNPALPGDILTVDERKLTGFIGAQILVDDRSPFDIYTTVDMPQAEFAGAQPFLGSAFTRFGKVVGGSDRQPHFFLRAREGQTVRLAYTVVNVPVTPVGHIGAVMRGYVVPSAILTAKTSS